MMKSFAVKIKTLWFPVFSVSLKTLGQNDRTKVDIYTNHFRADALIRKGKNTPVKKYVINKQQLHHQLF